MPHSHSFMTLLVAVVVGLVTIRAGALNLTAIDVDPLDRSGLTGDFTDQLFLQYQDECTGIYDYVFWGTDAFYLIGFRAADSVTIRVGNLYSTAVRANSGYLELVNCGGGPNQAPQLCLMFYFNNDFYIASSYGDGRWIFSASSTSTPSDWLRFVQVGAYLKTRGGARFLAMSTADTASGGRQKACSRSPFKLVLTRGPNARVTHAVKIRGISTGPEVG